MSQGIPACLAGRPRVPGPPPTIPDHQILRCIGVGSYGEVWLARNVLGVLRAVKVIRRHFFRDDRPFERELAGVRRFEPLSREDEGFVDILHTGRNDAEGYFYYVMELADAAAGGVVGEEQAAEYEPRTLARVLREQGALPVADCLALGLRLAGALVCLHRNGLIHRDIKPSNIIFVGGQARLADVGLVVEMSEARSFVGTDGYIPPEGPNSPQADIFALGKVLYEAGMGLDRLEFPRPGERMGEGPEGEALRELNALVLKACAANPAVRYRTVGEMAGDMEWIRSGRSVRRRFDRRRRQRLAIQAGGVLAVLAVVAAAVFWLRSLAVRARENREDVQALRLRAAQESVRGHNAKGAQLLARNDLSGAAIHFAAALPAQAQAEDPVAARIQRLRVNEALAGSARLTALWAAGEVVSSADFSPDGQRLATLDSLGQLVVWDVAEGSRVLGPMACGPGTLRVRFAPDGTRLWVDSATEAGGFVRRDGRLGTLQVFDAATGERRLPAGWPDGPGLLDAAGRHAVLLRPGRELEVREVESGRVLEQAESPDGEIRGVAISRDGGQVVWTDEARNLGVIQTGAGEAGRRRTVLSSTVSRLALAGSTDRLLVESGDAFSGYLVQSWQMDPLRPLGEPVSLADWSLGLQMDVHGGQCFLVAEGSRGMSLRSVEGGEVVLANPFLPTGRITCWTVSPDGLLLASAEVDGSARLWNLESGQPVGSSMHHDGPIRVVRFNPDGARLMTAGEDGLVKVWDFARRGRALPPLAVEGKWKHVSLGPIGYPAATSPEGRWMVVATSEGAQSVVQQIDLSCWSVTPVEVASGSQQGQVVWSHRGSLWASYDSVNGVFQWEHDAVLWHRRGENWVPILLRHPDMVTAAAFTADDSRLVTRDRSGHVCVWLTADGSLERVLDQVEQAPPWSPISTDGQWLVVRPTAEGAMRFMGLEDGGQWRFGGELVTGMSLVTGAFNPGNTAFAGVFSDRSVKIWAPSNGEEWSIPPGQIPPAQALRWSAGGQSLVTLNVQGPSYRVDLKGPSVTRLGGVLWDRSLVAARFAWDDRLLAVADTEGWVWVMEAATGEWVTPPRRHAGLVWQVYLDATGRLVTLSDPDGIRGWDLSDALPAADLLAWQTRLQAGRQLGNQDTLVPVPAGQLLEWWKQWRGRPESTVAEEAGEARGWFLDQFGDLGSLPRSRAAAFHAARWARATPGDSEVDELRRRIAQASIPDRDPSLPASSVDLSAYYTHALAKLAVDAVPRPGIEPGRRRIAGTEFDARGVVRLEEAGYAQRQRQRGGANLTSLPRTRVLGLPVHQPCRALVFLHGAQTHAGDQSRMYGRFRILLDDGTSHIFEPASPEPVGSVQIQGDRKVTPEYVRPALPDATPTPGLVISRWHNPTPGVAVRSVEFHLLNPSSRPFLLALTAE